MANEVMIGNIGVAPADPRVAVSQPDRAAANLISSAGELAGEAVQGYQLGRTERAMRQAAQGYDVASRLTEAGAKFDPETGEVVNQQEIAEKIDADLAAQIAAVEETSSIAFSKIKAGMEQGRGEGGNPYAGGVATASLYIENEIRKIAALTPGFEDVVRKTARDVLGFDPTGFGIRNILQVPKQADSNENPRIKGMREEAEARVWRANVNGINLSMEDALRQVTAEDSRRTMKESLAMEIETGNLTSDAATTEYFQTLANPMLNLLEGTIAAIDPDSGQTFGNMNGADRTQLMKNQQAAMREQEYNEAVAFARQAALSNGGRLTNQDLTRIREQTDRRWQGMDTVIDTMSRAAYAERWADELAKMANLQAWAVAPLIKFLNEGFNESIGLEFVKAMANTGSNSQLRLLIDRSDVLSQITGGGDASLTSSLVGQTLNDVFNGQIPVITGDPVIDKDFTKEVVADLWKNSGNNPEGRRQIANELSSVQPEMAYAMFIADPSEFGKYLSPESFKNMQTVFRTEVEMYTRSFADELVQSLDTARNPVGEAGVTGDTRGNDYQRLNAALTSIDNSGFVRGPDGKVRFSTNLGGGDTVFDRARTLQSSALNPFGSSTVDKVLSIPRGAINVAEAGYNLVLGNRLAEGATKRIAPLLSNDAMISRMNDGKLNNLDEFNTAFRRYAKAMALEQQLQVERERQSVNVPIYSRGTMTEPERQEQFETEQQQYIETLEGLLEAQQQGNAEFLGRRR